jgi:hypothetical protein
VHLQAVWIKALAGKRFIWDKRRVGETIGPLFEFLLPFVEAKQLVVRLTSISNLGRQLSCHEALQIVFDRNPLGRSHCFKSLSDLGS